MMPFLFAALAFLTNCIILLHTFWGIVFLEGCDNKKYKNLAVVVAGHMLVSLLVSNFFLRIPSLADIVYIFSCFGSFILSVLLGFHVMILLGKLSLIKEACLSIKALFNEGVVMRI